MAIHNKLKAKDVAPVRLALAKHQVVCPLCGGKFSPSGKKPVLDHDHVTGLVRDVLCVNCNGMEGKIYNLANRAKHKLTVKKWLQNLMAYYERHEVPRHGGLIHPTHKTEAEKRLLVNKRARARRAKAKG